MPEEKTPKISANKLGEYMVATPARRKGIIKDQKRPSPAISARYRHAEAPLVEFLSTGNIDALHSAAGKLRATGGGSVWAQGDREATADALEALGRLAPKLLLPELTYKQPTSRSQKLMIGGLPVSVQPDMLVFSEAKGKRQVGALKFHYIKNEESSLTSKGAQYVATLLHQWLLTFGPAGFVPTPALSKSVDVFRGNIEAAPASQSRRLSDLEAACEEITVRWPTL